MLFEFQIAGTCAEGGWRAHTFRTNIIHTRANNICPSRKRIRALSTDTVRKCGGGGWGDASTRIFFVYELCAANAAANGEITRFVPNGPNPIVCIPDDGGGGCGSVA